MQDWKFHCFSSKTAKFVSWGRQNRLRILFSGFKIVNRSFWKDPVVRLFKNIHFRLVFLWKFFRVYIGSKFNPLLKQYHNKYISISPARAESGQFTSRDDSRLIFSIKLWADQIDDTLYMHKNNHICNHSLKQR